ncbi:hypothetical protein [Candidatus Hodgkinia cicadicola]
MSLVIREVGWRGRISLWGDWWLDSCWLGSYCSVPSCEGKTTS